MKLNLFLLSVVSHNHTLVYKRSLSVWSYASHRAQCGVTTSHSTFCGCCVRDYHICFPLFAFVKSFRAHAVFERSTKGGWHNPAGSSTDGLVIWAARLSSNSNDKQKNQLLKI